MAGSDNRLSLLIELQDRPGALESALGVFSANGVNLTHIESRPARGGHFDFFVDCEGDREDPAIGAVIRALERVAVKLLVLDRQEVPWFPRHISELDRIAEHTLDAGVELEADHPGFKDPDYRQRRAHIDELARNYRHGQPVPEVRYTSRETQTWRRVYERLKPLHRAYACSAYRRIVAEMEAECGYGPAAIAQGRVVSEFLTQRTGFSIRPVPGLLASRDFLAGLAFRVFFATQYIRHHSKPLYTPEPDVCHELIGHAPMFADPAFADLSQEIGLASLGASDLEIEHLARCYWYSVEFGLLRENGALKAYGAGLLSSFGELEYACGEGDPGVELQPWEPSVAAERPFPITDYQPCYFVASSMHDARRRMRDYCRELNRPFYARFIPATERIWVDRAVRRQAS
jgi:phenylalanine-4-hydroxylase